MKKIWKITLAAGGMLAVLDGIAVGMAFYLAAARKCRLYRKRRGKRELEETSAQERRSGADWMESHGYRKATIRSEDGLRLTGRYLEAEQSKRLLILFHGWRGSWQHDFGPCLKSLYDRDCSLLIVDQRAQGESEGSFMGFGVLECRDCLRWISWAKDVNKAQLPIYLYGMSMGAATVLMAAGEALGDCVKGVIADCGFTSPYDMVRKFAQTNFGMRERPIMRQLDWVFQKRAGYSLKETDTLKAMVRCRIPVLFIHGKEDTFVPYEMTVENYNACTSRKDILLVEGADHCMSFMKDRESYLQKLDEMFQRNDRGA